ncbi:MAG TPA: hypothetical protein DCS66_13370 [Flavobacteriaceae bacterium]|nr:hypothetical protein [Flavobacteriaceae bacterium]HAT65565.1 hypothetical protein [Flavobacteriaceae bacterium]|tara:strand:+ start:74693 stop:75022 length:330 start_codon:yes stop_codon:yes gene_type:complete
MKKLILVLLLFSSFSGFSQDKNDNSPVAITQSSTAHFSVYPNPVEDRLSVITTLEDYSIEIINSTGQVVNFQKNNNGLQTVDYSNLASGMYLLKLTSGDISESFKIVRL